MELKDILGKQTIDQLNSIKENNAEQKTKQKKNNKQEYFFQRYGLKSVQEALDYLKQHRKLSFRYDIKPRIAWTNHLLKPIRIEKVEYDEYESERFGGYEFLSEQEFIDQFSKCGTNKYGYIEIFTKCVR